MSAMPPRNSSPDALLAEHREVMDRLEGCVNRQESTLRTGDTDGLVECLSERSGIVDELSDLADELDARIADGGTDPDSAGRMRAAIDASARLADRILEGDRAQAALLASARDEIAGELSMISKGRRAVSTYFSPPVEPRPAFQDREI